MNVHEAVSTILASTFAKVRPHLLVPVVEVVHVFVAAEADHSKKKRTLTRIHQQLDEVTDVFESNEEGTQGNLDDRDAEA